MVVCMVVRVRNVSSRTFFLTPASDPFYVPKVGGQPCVDGKAVEIPSDFDAPAEGLVVPWAATSSRGLVFGEAGHSEEVRCVVGPSDYDDGETDWLRLHEPSWEPLAEDHWLALGRRHFMGAIGGVVDLQLTFRDPSRWSRREK
jgi:hypothetical protein